MCRGFLFDIIFKIYFLSLKIFPFLLNCFFFLNYYVRNSNDKAAEALGLLSAKVRYLAIRFTKNVFAYGKATQSGSGGCRISYC